MSMFSWSGGTSQDSSEVVSHRFWIYWAITIPLTALTIIIWRVWWIWQERGYQKDVKEAVGEAGNAAEVDEKGKIDEDRSTLPDFG